MSNILTKYVIVNQILNTYDKDIGVSAVSLRNRIENLGIRNIVVEYWGGTVIIKFEDIKFKLFLKDGTYFDPVEGTKTYVYMDKYECNKTLKEVVKVYYRGLMKQKKEDKSCK